jgi:SAM-dependent methyltransferase
VDEAFWDERYRSAPKVWSGKPNPHLVADAAELSPGSALDVGAGEGADTIWLAEQGWTVTGIEISGVALERARKEAAERPAAVAERITWLHADLAEWEPPVDAYDLVSIHFMHLLPAERTPMYRRLAASVTPGGVLLVVGHHPSDLETTARRPPDPDLLFTADALAEDLGEGWTILAQDARPRTAVDPEGETITIHDAVLVARRSGPTG